MWLEGSIEKNDVLIGIQISPSCSYNAVQLYKFMFQLCASWIEFPS
jgi:hypothetical protein